MCHPDRRAEAMWLPWRICWLQSACGCRSRCIYGCAKLRRMPTAYLNFYCTRVKSCWIHFPVNRLSTTNTMHHKFLSNLSIYFSSALHTHTLARTRCIFPTGKSHTINFHDVNVYGALNHRRWFIFTICVFHFFLFVLHNVRSRKADVS